MLRRHTAGAAAAVDEAVGVGTAETTVTLAPMAVDEVVAVDEAEDTVEADVAVEATKEASKMTRNNRTSISPTAITRTKSGRQ